MSVAVALLQVSVTDDEPVDGRTERVLRLAREVGADHDVVVLPELWSVGAFSTELMTAHAEPLDGPPHGRAVGKTEQHLRLLLVTLRTLQRSRKSA